MVKYVHLQLFYYLRKYQCLRTQPHIYLYIKLFIQTQLKAAVRPILFNGNSRLNLPLKDFGRNEDGNGETKSGWIGSLIGINGRLPTRVIGLQAAM